MTEPRDAFLLLWHSTRVAPVLSAEREAQHWFEAGHKSRDGEVAERDYQIKGLQEGQGALQELLQRNQAQVAALREVLSEYTERIRRETIEQCAEEVASFPGGDFRAIADHLRALGTKEGT